MKREVKKRVGRRLKIIEGQVRGLQAMVQKEKYCPDIITQASAIKEALSGIEGLLLENHLLTHVREQMRSGREDRAMREMFALYKLSRRRK